MHSPRPKSKEKIDPVLAQVIVGYVDDREEEIAAIVHCLEQRLAQLCNAGGTAPDGAPLTEWHLARALRNMMESLQFRRCVSGLVGVKR